jgi:hypothetical protein
MSNRRDIELESVRRLLELLGRPAASVKSADPPAPDVLVTYIAGARQAFEVTQLHPDEVPGQGSAVRAAEEQHAKRDPLAGYSMWIRTDALPAIRNRVEEKVKKASGYRLESEETLSLLLVASLPESGAVAATTVFAFLLDVQRLNETLHELLVSSRFESVYLHLMLVGAVYRWDRAARWHVVRAADDFVVESREILGFLKSHGGFGPAGQLPGTRFE